MTHCSWALPILKKKIGARSAPTSIWILSLVIGHSVGAVLGLALAVAPAGAEGPQRVVYLFRDTLWSAHPDGTRARPLTKGMAVYAFDVTADGKRVAFAAGAWKGERRRRKLVASEVWVVNADGTGLRRLAGPSRARGTPARVGHLRWSPDGQSLAFDVVGDRNAPRGGAVLYVVRLPDGAARRAAPGLVASFAWTAEGQIRYQEATPANGGQPEGHAAPAAAGSSPANSPPAGEVTAATVPPLPPGAVPQPQPDLVRPPAASPPAAAASALWIRPPSAPAAFGAGAE